MRQVAVRDLDPRMIVAEDLYGPDGRILLKRGTPLDAWYIQRLQEVRLTSVLVDDFSTAFLDNHYVAHQIRELARQQIVRWLPDASCEFHQAWRPIEAVVQTIEDEPTLSLLLLRLSQRQRQWFHHAVQRAALGMVMAQGSTLTEPSRRSLVMGLLLQDIGNMGLSDEIAVKATPLTATERRLVHLHPELAVERLQKITAVSPDALQVVLRHHERLDGSGYPNGLLGSQIDALSQMAAVADVYCALGQDRAHRGRMAPAYRDSILRGGAGTLFNATYVEDLLKRPKAPEEQSQTA